MVAASREQRGILRHPRGHPVLHIDGRREGTLRIGGDLVVGEKGCIMADVIAHNVWVAGTVKGNIYAHQVQVLSTGEVWGNVSTDYFALDEGGVIQGQIDQHCLGEPHTPFQSPEELLKALEALETDWSKDRTRDREERARAMPSPR